MSATSSSLSLITTRKGSLGQGNMFTGVCLSWGGAWSWGVPGPGRVPGPRGAWSWGPGPGWVPGPGGVSGPVGVPGHGRLVLGGTWSRGGCLVETPRTATAAAGGTHPTGMHSCLIVQFAFYVSRQLIRLYRQIHAVHLWLFRCEPCESGRRWGLRL